MFKVQNLCRSVIFPIIWDIYELVQIICWLQAKNCLYEQNRVDFLTMTWKYVCMLCNANFFPNSSLFSGELMQTMNKYIEQPLFISHTNVKWQSRKSKHILGIIDFYIKHDNTVIGFNNKFINT